VNTATAGASPSSTPSAAPGSSTRASRARARTSASTVSSGGHLLVAHIRQKTIGDTSLVNTHPFQRAGWVFAHNGTIKDVAWLRAGVSPERLAEIEGETDSELLFSWVLTRLDEAGVTAAKVSPRTDRALAAAARTAREHPGIGAFNFLLSDGATTYAHRFGRSMFLLEKSPGDAVVARRESSDGTVVETPWSAGRAAILIASERINDEPWQEVEDSALLCVERLPSPHVRLVA